MRIFAKTFGLILLLLNIAFSLGSVRVKHIEGDDVTGTILKIDNENIHIKTQNSDEPVTLLTENLEEIEFSARSVTQPEDIFLHEVEINLTSGDIIHGRILRETDDEEGFMLETLSFGIIPIKIDWVERIVNADNTVDKITLDPSILRKKSDAIYFKPKQQFDETQSQIDVLIGTVNAITAEGVDFTDNIGFYRDYVFRWSDILALTIESSAKVEIPKIFQVIAICRTGEKFLGELISYEDDVWTFRSPILKTTEIIGKDEEIWKQHTEGLIVKIPASKLQKLTFRYGNFAYLSDIEPSEVDEFPYFGGRGAVSDKENYWWRYKMDKSITGNALFLADKQGRRSRITKGISVHSYSKLTFDLGGEYSSFKADIGLEADVGNLASVIFRVFCDDEKEARFESPIMRRNSGYMSISIDIENVKKLHLEVDFADNGDIQDRAIWGRARIFKKDIADE